MPFAFKDPCSFAWTTPPSGRYDAASNVRCTGGASGVIEFFDAAADLYKSPCGLDYLLEEHSVQTQFVSKTGTADVIKHQLRNGAYTNEYNVSTGAIAIKRGGTTLASGTATINANAVLRSEVSGFGASIQIRLYVNNLTTPALSATDTTGAAPAGRGGVGSGNISAGGVLRVKDVRIGPLVVPTPLARPVLRSRVMGYLGTLYAGEPDTKGQVIPILWNSGGTTSNWAGFLHKYVRPFIDEGWRRWTMRGPWGNNTFGWVVGEGYHEQAVPPDPMTQAVANVLDARACDCYRSEAKSGVPDVMSDARLLDNFLTANYEILSLLDEMVYYGSMPPNGARKTGSAGSVPQAWTNSAAAFDEFDAEILALGDRASAGKDILTVINCGPNDGATPAESVLGRDYIYHLRTRTHRTYGEPHPSQKPLGTAPNTVRMMHPTLNLMSVTNPNPGDGRAQTVINDPQNWIGREDLGPAESVAWIDGSWPAAQRPEIAAYLLGRGWSVAVELSGTTVSQRAQILAADAAGGFLRPRR